MENTNQEAQEANQSTSEPITGLNAGAIVKGKVMAIKDDKVVVDFGAPFKGEMLLSAMNEANVIVGASYEFMIEDLDLANQQVALSKKIADNLRIWNRVKEAFDKKAQIAGEVVAQCKGGYSVDLGLRAFLPNTQADIHPLADERSIVGQTMQFVITKFDEQKSSVVVSRRAILEAERAAGSKEVFAKLQEGQVVDGVVSNIAKYGAFVDIGGIDGLLHINDLSYEKPAKVEDVVKIGDKLKVKIIKLDNENQKVSLGLKQLQADPWESYADKLVVGNILEGQVVSLAKYGAFVQLFPGLQGLIHISTFSWTKNYKNPADLLKVGETVKVYLLEVNKEEHRISLSIKHLSENPWQAFAKEHPAGSKIKGVVQDIVDFGLFVKVAENISGLLHRSDISWTERNINLNERFKAGDELEVVVLAIDLEKQRLSLGLKQLTEDPWVVFTGKYQAGQVVTATVKSIEKYGVFMEVEPGFIGLCHVSELAEDRVEDISSVVEIGKETEVAILAIDVKKQKISLSLKAAKDGGAALEYIADQNKSLGQLADVMPETLKNNGDK